MGKMGSVASNNDGIFARGTFETRGIDRGFHALSSDYSLDKIYEIYGAGATFKGKPIVSLQDMLPHIATGRTIDNANGVITYTFNDIGHLVGLFNNPKYGFTAGDGFSPYSPAQQAAAREAIAMWDELIPQSFRESQGMGADIVFSNSSDPAQAYAYYPLAKGGQKFASDVFTANPSENWTNEWFTPGGYGNTTLIHELGHTLGLSHPGRYNGAAATNYAGQAEYAQDSMQYTIMSYWSGSETNALTINWSLFLNNYAQTPMLHDIYAIQSQYGADPTTRTGNTVYGFNSNAGHLVYDFAQNPYPYLAIYDAGGIDTIDASGFTTSQFIDLHAGSFSSIGGAAPTTASVDAARLADGFAALNLSQAQINATVANYQNAAASRIANDQALLGKAAVLGITATEYQNVSIAYGTTIENAIGGSGRDLIHGNEVANVLDGGAGNDVIRGFEGNDTLIGGLGNDQLEGDAGNDIIIGGAGADLLTGGSGADHFVFDQLTGDTGNRITDLSADDILDFSRLDIDLSFIGNAAFSASGHAELAFVGGVLQGDFDGNGTVDFSVQFQAGAGFHADQLVLHA